MNYDHMTDEQKAVFNAAKARLEVKKWYRGICTDMFPTHDECVKEFDDSVDGVVMQTMYWDCPGGIFGENT